MSDKDKQEAAGDEADVPKKSKKKLIILIVVGVVVLAMVGVAAALMLGKSKPDDGEAATEDTEQVEEDEAHALPPAYLKLEPFTTNLAMDEAAPAGTAGQYIQVVVEMKLEDAKTGESLKAYTPEIRNIILRLLSSKHAAELSSTEGKDKLAEEIADSVNAITGSGKKKKGKGRDGPVQAVLFSSFIIQ